MSKITLVKSDAGELDCFSRSDKRAYGRFKKLITEMEFGELLTFAFFFPRNPRLHAKHMGMLRLFFESQETFADYDRFREWTQIGAGHVNWIPGVDGVMQAVPKSISFAECDDEEMNKVHEDTKTFFRTDRAQVTMWPGLDPNIRSIGAEALVGQFEKEDW